MQWTRNDQWRWTVRCSWRWRCCVANFSEFNSINSYTISCRTVGKRTYFRCARHGGVRSQPTSEPNKIICHFGQTFYKYIQFRLCAWCALTQLYAPKLRFSLTSSATQECVVQFTAAFASFVSIIIIQKSGEKEKNAWKIRLCRRLSVVCVCTNGALVATPAVAAACRATAARTESDGKENERTCALQGKMKLISFVCEFSEDKGPQCLDVVCMSLPMWCYLHTLSSASDKEAPSRRDNTSLCRRWQSAPYSSARTTYVRLSNCFTSFSAFSLDVQSSSSSSFSSQTARLPAFTHSEVCPVERKVLENWCWMNNAREFVPIFILNNYSMRMGWRWCFCSFVQFIRSFVFSSPAFLCHYAVDSVCVCVCVRKIYVNKKTNNKGKYSEKFSLSVLIALLFYFISPPFPPHSLPLALSAFGWQCRGSFLGKSLMGGWSVGWLVSIAALVVCTVLGA